MRVVELTPNQIIEDVKKIRLAAYCRVSTDKTDQINSFFNQIKYYTDYTKKNPQYELVEIYADEGLTGTDMKRRNEFNRLLDDCRKRKIDRVITKSASRFARNTQDFLVVIRMLKELDVSVYFEEQGIDTSKMNMEMFATFPGLIAQQESESISQNMRWSYQKRMQSGEYNTSITLTKSCNLRFYAWAYNMNTSGVGSELYAINTSSSGRAYHLVTVYTDLPQAEGDYYQALIKDSVLFNDDELKSIEGYQYDGLYEDVDHTILFENGSEVITESMTLYAHYIPNVYTATFKDENGNILATVKANYGESAEEPAAPDKEGYVFVGWDSDDYLCMTKDGTFTAKYVSKEDYATVAFTKTFKSCQAGSSLNLKKYIKIDPVEKKDEVELTWSSSDTIVATVDENGVVDFLAPGMTTITVIVESSGETASVDFTVTPDPNRQITLNNNSILGFDSARNLREIPDGKNTVGELREQFMNDELHFYKVNGEEYTELSDTDKVGTGTVIRLLDDNGEVIDEVTAIMTGDYNGDGRITNLDGTFLGQYLLHKREITDVQRYAMDVNNDKSINLKDKTLLGQYLVGRADFEVSI